MTKITLEIEVVDGATFITSPEIPGLLSAHNDRHIAMSDVIQQIDVLTRENGSPSPWEDSSQCDNHVWLDVTNEVVSGTKMCKICGKLEIIKE